MSYGLNFIADLLNLRSLNTVLPSELEGLYEAEAYRTSQVYTQVKTQVAWISSTLSLAVTLVFWLTGGFALLDQ